MSDRCSLLAVILIVLLSASPAASHPGGRDSNGGHRDGSTGRYHFHEGPLAGQEFDSKEEALAALSGTGGSSPPTPEPAPAAAGNTISLASWNIRNISRGSRSNAELGIISLIIFRYDFIALQEVLDREVIERVQKILRDDFQAEYALDVSGEVGHNKKERYAFMWRKDRVEQIFPGAFYLDPGDKFEREPFCGSFRAGNFDWTMCTIHLLFGDDEEDRRPELLVLDDVYRSMRDAGAEKDVILCGDFNFGPDDVGWTQLKAEDGMSFAIAPPAKTTIVDVSLYDNCWWPTATAEVIAGSGGVFEFDELMYPPGSRKEANRLTSDHRPIHILVRTDEADDD